MKQISTDAVLGVTAEGTTVVLQAAEQCCVDRCCIGECCEGECCPAGTICCNVQCEATFCSLLIDDSVGCPRGSVEMTMTASCAPDCDMMTFSMNKSVQYVTVNLPPPMACEGSPQELTFTVQIDSAAPPGPIVFEVIGTTNSGAQCATVTTVVVSDEAGGCCGAFLCPNETSCCNPATGLCCSIGEECCEASNECCSSGSTCCGGLACCLVDHCCADGTCCATPCEMCIGNGSLSGGTIDVNPDPACVGDTITFTADGVVDSGGIKQVDCVVKTEIPAVAPTYTWVITKPDGSTEERAGETASVIADLVGEYSCVFTANAERECAPPEFQVGPQAAKAVKIHPKSVTFSGTTYHAISQDDGTGDYPTPHWKDNSSPTDNDNADVGDHNFPVAFVRNSYMQLSAEFTVEPPDGLSGATSATVEGIGTAGGYTFQFAGTAAVAGGTITLSTVQADVVLPNSIQYFNPMSIDWTITPQNGDALDCIPATNHRVYVLLAMPNNGSRFETLIHMACTNAINIDNAANAIPAIWNEFTDLVVRRKPIDGLNNPDNQQLTYYANWNCVNIETAQLLATGDGQCGSWAKLFIDSLGVHGINHVNEWLFFYNRVKFDLSYGFIVRNWTFASGGGNSGFPDYPYLNIPDTLLISNGVCQWRFSEVSENLGIPGQGNVNPASLFNNHQVVRLTTPLTTYHDPSYGLLYNSLGDIDSTAIGGYFRNGLWPVDEPTVNLDLNNDGDMTDLQVNTEVYVFQPNAAGNELVEHATEYPSP